MINQTVLLRDEFDDTRAAGAVNGTLATDGTNTRAATDTGNKISIASGDLVISSGLGSPSANDPILNYPLVTRTPGLVMAMYVPSFSGRVYLEARTNLSVLNQIRCIGTTVTCGTHSSGINTATISTPFSFYLAIRASGAHYFTQASSGYPLLNWINDSISSSQVMASIFNYDGTNVHVGWLRMSGYWLPTPLTSDGFGASGTSDGLGHAETSGVGSGGSGVTWTGATWSASGGKAINTPSVGSELFANGDFSLWTGDNPNSWIVTGESGSNPMVTQVGNTARIYSTASAVNMAQVVGTSGKWYRFSVDVTITAGTLYLQDGGGFPDTNPNILTSGTHVRTYRKNGSLSTKISSRTYPCDAIVDNASFKELTFSSLIALQTLSTSDVYTGVDLVISPGNQSGVALNWDSTSSPANGVIAYHDGTNAKLEKCVAGTWTSVISAAATYSAGARLVVSKIGTAYRLYYNNALVGSGTISDAGIVSNTKHGLFSTDSSNTLDNFVVYASGSGGEYDSDLSLIFTETLSASTTRTFAETDVATANPAITLARVETCSPSNNVTVTDNLTLAETKIYSITWTLTANESLALAETKAYSLSNLATALESLTLDRQEALTALAAGNIAAVLSIAKHVSVATNGYTAIEAVTPTERIFIVEQEDRTFVITR